MPECHASCHGLNCSRCFLTRYIYKCHALRARIHTLVTSLNDHAWQIISYWWHRVRSFLQLCNISHIGNCLANCRDFMLVALSLFGSCKLVMKVVQWSVKHSISTIVFSVTGSKTCLQFIILCVKLQTVVDGQWTLLFVHYKASCVASCYWLICYMNIL